MKDRASTLLLLLLSASSLAARPASDPLAGGRQARASGLHAAAERGDLEQVALYLRAGRRLDEASQRDDRRTPLHLAAEAGRLEVVRLLLQAGAKLEARTGRGFTPLHLAAIQGHAQVAELLLAQGASRAALDERGLRPLHLAALAGRTEAVRALLPPVGEALARDPWQWTALHHATAVGALECARLLAARAVHIDRRTASGSSALHFAARRADRELMQLLLEAGADPEARDALGRRAQEVFVEALAQRARFPRREQRVARARGADPALSTPGKGSSKREPIEGDAPAVGRAGLARGASATELGSPPGELLDLRERPPELFTTWTVSCVGPGPPPEGTDLALWADGALLFCPRREEPNVGLRLGHLPRERLAFLWRELEETGALAAGGGQLGGPGSTLRSWTIRRGTAAATRLGVARGFGARPGMSTQAILIARDERLVSELLELALPAASWPLERVATGLPFRGYDPTRPSRSVHTWESDSK